MAKDSGVIWCDSSVNPVMGCDGCELANPKDPDAATCYAKILHDMRSQNKGYADDFFVPEMFEGRMKVAASWGQLQSIEREGRPWMDGRPRMIFISDMGDALSGDIPNDWLCSEILDNCASPQGRRHQWLWLTKRPSRFGELARHYGSWPANVMAMTSVTSARTIWRARQLAELPSEFKWRGLSCEPLFDCPDLGDYLIEIDWLITGGESGSREKASPFHLAWAQSLGGQCKQAGTSFFLKQLGRNPVGVGYDLQCNKGENWDEWPVGEFLDSRQVPEFD